jgi:lysophospholipase
MRLGLPLAPLALLVALTGAACAAPTDDDAGDGSAAATESAPPAWSKASELSENLPAIQTFFAKGTFGAFEGVNGVAISHVSFVLPAAREKAALVFFPGRTESLLKYAETAWDLTRRGYSVYIMDHRGQGFSGRILISEPQKGYVDAFGDYITDAKTFVDTVVRARPHDKVVGIGHSMGGAILTMYAMREPDAFSGIVLASPMHKIKFPVGSAGEYAMQGLAKAGTATEYAWTQGPYNRHRENDYSTSEVRWGGYEDRLLASAPKAVLGGATNRWVDEAIKATREIREQAGSLKTPALLLVPSAENDTAVDSDASTKVCKTAKNCRKADEFAATKDEAGAMHELFIEADYHRSRALDEIVHFVDGLTR